MPQVQPNTASTAELTQTFLQFVLMQTQQALLAMGRHPSHQGSDKAPPVNLDLAKAYVAHLVAINMKTKGNLNGDEQMALNNAISHLQNEFAESVKTQGGKS